MHLDTTPENSREVGTVQLPSPVANTKDVGAAAETVIIDDSLVQDEQALLESDQDENVSSETDEAAGDGDVEMQDLTADAGDGLNGIAQLYNNEQ